MNSAALSQRKKDAGLVKISKSIWVLEAERESAQAALEKGVSGFRKRADEAYKKHTGK